MSNIDSNFDLQEYLTKGGERLIADVIAVDMIVRSRKHLRS